MSRENAIQYRSPQQIPSSKKPNIENCPPQRNTNEFIKQMKKRVDQAPLSVMTQNSQIKDAQSIFIDMSRIEQQSSNSNNSFYDPLKQPVLPQCHRSNQPSNCTTQRTNRYDMQRNSKPYLDQSENMGLLLIQQQMLSLQNENMNLKQQLEKQESQRLLFQQQLLQQFQTQQQQQQQPIVINNNITSFEKQQSQSKSIPPQHYQDETESPPKRIQGKKQQSQAIQTDKSVQDQSIITLNESFQNESLCNRSKQIISQQSQIRPPQQQKQSIESLTFGTQLSQRNLISQQSQQQLQIQTHNSQSRNQSYQQINQGSIELQTENTQKDCQIQNQRDISRKHSQIDIINSPALQDQSYCAYNPELPKKSQPSVKLEFNFDEGTNKGSNKKCLADYFTQRKKTTNFDRRVSVQAPIQEEDQSWIVNVKQRSKEEQIKLRKEMMEYGRNKRQQNKSQTPVNEDKISDRKEQIKKSKSPLMERLSMGQKAKVMLDHIQVEEKEMFALTKKNYENLPEVKKKKNQEESIKQKQQFMRERQNKLKELDDVIIIHNFRKSKKK